MNDKLKNLRLEAFFHDRKLTKKASTLGHFSDVITEDDLKAVSTMIHKMVMLPKYNDIKTRLKNATGIVNFVTYDEFEPLIEAIFRVAIPPAGNDIYHMGNGFTLPEDYAVDAKGIFGGQGDEGASQKALEQMGFLVKGTPKKMTKAWLKEHGVDPEGPMFTSVFGGAAEELLAKITAYEEQLGALKTSDLRVEIADLFKRLDKDRMDRVRLAEIEKVNKGKPEQQRISLPKVLSQEEILKLRNQLRKKRGFYAMALQGIENEAAAPPYDISVRPDMFSHENEDRSGDGFLDWAPEDEIRKVYIDIIDSISNVAEGVTEQETETLVTRKFANLKLKLQEYRTTDPDLIARRQRILDFLNTGQPVQKYNLNSATFTRLMSEFLARANEHGKIMIFKNVDSSALTTAPSALAGQGKVPSGARLQNWGIFGDFVAANDSNMVRDLEGGKRTTRGKRTIILISSYPLQGMPKGASTIEMDTSPVDEAESKIIVDSLIDAHANDAVAAATLKMAYDIEKKYANVTDPDQLNKKDIEASQIGNNLMTAKTQMAYISPQGRRTMQQMIQGMGQKVAIAEVKRLLATNKVVERDEDGMVSSIKYNEPELLQKMLEEFTVEKAKAVPGLHLRFSKVSFDDYITKQGSVWGSKVGLIAFHVKSVETCKQDIELHRQEILRIDSDLRAMQFSPQTKADKIKLRNQHDNEIKKLTLQMENLYKMIPHFVVLRGKPGVGKSVFGDALADLLKFPVYNVRIQEVFDKWVGNTEKNTELLLNAVFSSRNAVYLIDEIDRVLDMPGQDSGGAGEGGGGHATEKKVVADFLARFGDDTNLLIQRNVYVIMTTNHIKSVDNALLKRTKGDVYDVEASDNPEDYLKFLKTFIVTERKDNPEAPWMIYEGNTNEEMWDFTMKYINESIDLKRLAVVFATKGLSFRSLSGLVKNACVYHSSYNFEFKNAIARGDPVEPTGMPMTTANMLEAAELVNDDSSDSAQVNIGVHDVYNARIKAAKEMWPKIKMIMTEEKHPITGKPTKRFKLPEEYLKLMDGTEPKEDVSQYDVTEGVGSADPSVIRDPRKTLQPSQPAQPGQPTKKDMKQLTDEGMLEDQDIEGKGTDQEKVDGPKDSGTKKKQPQGKFSSSTEYLYSFLVDKGVIDGKGVVVAQKKPLENAEGVGGVEGAVPQAPQAYDSLEQYGTYYFNNAQILMMSVDNNVPPLTFRN